MANPRTPFNSTVGDLRRTSPPLPPIKRSEESSTTSSVEESKEKVIKKNNFFIFLWNILEHTDEFVPSVSINEFATTDPNRIEEENEEKW